MLWSFVVREPFSTVCFHLFFCQGLVFFDNENLDCFPRIFVRNSNGSGLKNFWILGQPILNFIGIHIETRRQNHVFFSVDQFDVSTLHNHTDITSVKPAIFENFFGLLRSLVVALHHLWPTNFNLTDFSLGQDISLGVHYGNFCTRQRDAHRAWNSCEIKGIHCDDW